MTIKESGAVSARIVGGQPIVKGPELEQDAAALMGLLIEAVRAPRQTFVVT